LKKKEKENLTMTQQSQTLRTNLREAYDKFALERESSIMEDWKTEERSRFLSALQKENKKKVLEIGAGTGRDSKYFQDQGLEVVCIDLSPVMIELCRQKGLMAHVMDMSNIDFPEHSFEAVYALNSMLHLTKKEFPAILHRINALLSADGLVYIGVYGGYDYVGLWENDPYTPKRFFSFFSDEDLEHEVSRVFDILTFNCVFFAPDDPIHFQSLLLRKRSSQQAG
jgi:SAM-dependent methyltransferase